MSGWQLVFAREHDAHGAYLIDSVQILRGGVARGRITVFRPSLAAMEAQQLLRARAQAWMADYESRNPEV